MRAPHPQEFRDDVIAVARRGDAPIAQIAKDFGISESCLRNWLSKADVDDGVKPGVSSAEHAENRELKKGCGCSRRRTRSCDVPRPTCPGPT